MVTDTLIMVEAEKETQREHKHIPPATNPVSVSPAPHKENKYETRSITNSGGLSIPMTLTLQRLPLSEPPGTDGAKLTWWFPPARPVSDQAPAEG